MSSNIPVAMPPTNGLLLNDSLQRLFDVSDQSALRVFLQSIGCRQDSLFEDLQFVQEDDLKESSLSKVLQRKVLLVKEFIELGGSVSDVKNLQEVRKGIQVIRTTDPTTETEQVIHLNVGGNRFTTTRKTLCSVPGSVLESMFSGRFPNNAHRTEDGTYVIDRDGSQFSHVLNFLRVGTVVSLPQTKEEREALAVEADFYGLEALLDAIQCPLSIDMTEHLPEEVLTMWNEENRIRSALLEGLGENLDSHEGLVSVFEERRRLPFRFRPSGTDRHKIPTLMDLHRDNLTPGQTVTVESMEEFTTNFNKEHTNVLNRIRKILQEEPVIIAGGAVLRALTVGENLRPPAWWQSGNSDIDLFIHSSTPAEASLIARRLFYALSVDEEPWVVLRGRGVIAMHTWNFNWWSVDKKTQVVLRLYDSPAEVLYGFDVDCCGCAFDGRRVWATPRCLHAIQTGVNFINPLHAWPNRASYEIRLGKYASRGYAVAVPGLDERRVDHHIVSATELGKLKGLARLLKVAHSIERNTSSSAPKEPIYRDDLKEETKKSMEECEQLVKGYWDEGPGGDLYDEVTSIVIPSVFGEDNDARGYPLMWRQGYYGEYMFPKAHEIRDKAWAEIESSEQELPPAIPALLLEAWTTEKRSREYLNASMERIDLDSLYYQHAYPTTN